MVQSLLKSIAIAVFVGAILVGKSANAQSTPTLQQEANTWPFKALVNLIFTSNINWYGVRFNNNLEFNEVSSYDEKNCTVRLRSGPMAQIDGVINLNAVKSYDWYRYSSGRGMLVLKGEGLIVDGKYSGRSTGMEPRNGCSGTCEFFTPVDYGAWLPIAFNSLYSKFCGKK